MRIIGIDPSFSSCGVACVDNGELYTYGTFKQAGKVYQGINETNSAAQTISKGVLDFCVLNKPDAIIIEYPAQSQSGFYLMCLHGWLVSRLTALKAPLYFVPPTAVDSFLKNKEHSKSFIVNTCKSNKWVPEIRINNDVCTAVVLTHVLSAYLEGYYKNKVFRL